MKRLILRGGKVLDVRSGALREADVAVEGDLIAEIGPGLTGDREVDCRGKFLIPGLIDAHMHIESTLVTPRSLAASLVRKGTTTCIADPHEFVNVKGAAALRWLVSAVRELPVTYEIMIPGAVPATPFDTNGAGKFLARDMAEFLGADGVLGLGEMMCFREVLANDREALNKLALWRGHPIDGHAPGLTDEENARYCAAGILTDHECTTFEEALSKLLAGLYVLIREGSGAQNLRAIVTGMLQNGIPFDRCCFCTDDKHLADIEAQGHINHCVNLAIECGMAPTEAIRVATCGAADIYGLGDLGELAPGKRADILVCESLARIEPELVVKDGRIVDDAWLTALPDVRPAPELLDTVHLGALTPERLAVPAHARDHVIGMVSGQLLTEHLFEALPQKDGYFVPDQNFNKLIVAERHGRNGNVAACALKGFGLRGGAVATSVSHDSHNLIAAGDNDADLIAAARRVETMHGGFAVVSGGEILAELALPVCGLVSELPSSEVRRKADEVIAAARSLGTRDGVDPVTNLSFLALPVIPSIRLLDTGLFDADRFEML